jgi:membrane protease YdiL (CAAX protease family)
MSDAVRATPGFWRTVALLLRFAWRRSRGRAQRQRQLLGSRTGSDINWGGLGTLMWLVVAATAHGLVAYLLVQGVDVAQRVWAESAGKMVVSERCLESLERDGLGAPQACTALDADGNREQAPCSNFLGEGRAVGVLDEPRAYDARLLRHYRQHGPGSLVPHRSLRDLVVSAAPLDPLTALLASLLLVAWFIMLAFLGEGVELDLQRRRHPMWEWLLGHPVDPRAVFLGEMLSSVAANPFFWMAPVFWIGLFWAAYDFFATALLAGLATGIPLAIAAGCTSKALEVSVMLRLAPRSRGAVLGIFSWAGQATFFALPFLAIRSYFLEGGVGLLVPIAGAFRAPLADWALGLHGHPSAAKGVLACWCVASVLIALAMQVCARATRKGLAGGFAGALDAPRLLAQPRAHWVGDPVHRKELLWLWRDRGSLVQVFLVPLTLAAYQLLNLDRFLADLRHGWHLMAGASVLFGSYFLLILGPRSLLSEGAALWIPLTWPRGLEALLRAKARLWWLASLVVVAPPLVLTAVWFPSDAWRVAVVELLWVAFARSLAEKTVTLVTAPSSSGDAERVPTGRRLAATLGTFSFGVGLLSRQWSLAVVGVVYSWLTAAAMWQGFRARLPYLFDPSSERSPPAPTLLHAMVAVSVAVESTMILLALSLTLGAQATWAALSMAYALGAVGTCVAMHLWLAGRGVLPRRIWRWDGVRVSRTRLAQLIPLGAALGLALALGARGYVALLEQLPGLGVELVAASRALDPSARVWLGLLSVGLAPVAEEFLFRGLLFRALDREWGGFRAVAGSACFFAIYHPPVAWLPVGLVGAASALLFKRTQHLLPSVALHMAYNAAVLWAT